MFSRRCLLRNAAFGWTFASDTENSDVEAQVLKFIGGTVGVIFLIGLLVVIGLLMLIF